MTTSMNRATASDLEEWIEQLMTQKNVQDYKVKIAGNSVKGDGYLGEITFASVCCTDSNKEYNLVIKSAKKSDELRKQTPIKEAYDRESFMYSKIFPIFREFQQLKALEKPFDNLPKCYSVHNEDRKEAIILQNLKKIGFDLHDRQVPMNLNHVLLVFRQYGMYHALSLALKRSKPSIFDSVTKNMTDVLGNFILQAKMLDGFRADFENAKKYLMEDNELNVLKKYEGFEDEFEKILVNFSNKDTVPSVITHGDCWNNNFMFKYDGQDKTKPTDMRFLDFQLSRVASPIIDLSYFLYSCGDGNIFKDIDFILQAYHSSLSDFLQDLGYNDLDDVFSLKKLKEQWKIFGKFGVVMSLFILKIELCNSDEAPDLMENAENNDGGINMDIKEFKNQKVYEKRVKEVLIHFAEKFM